MEPLLDVMEDGINLKCPDGERRYCVPVIASYIADYEEQRVLAGIVSGYCPKCTIPSFVSLKDQYMASKCGISTHASRARLHDFETL